MRKSRRPLTADEGGKLIGLLAILLGAFVYLYPPMLAGFPINDGGLFYRMIRAVQEAGFRLPQTINYNGLSIPFVYPPLGFYVAGLIGAALGIDPLLLLQWLPAMIAILSSVALYVLAKELLDSPIEAGIATFLYVCTPRSATWLIMGGGLTRGLGQLFMILTMTAAHRMFTRRSPQAVAATIVCGALVVLSHPEAALHTAAVCLLLWLLHGRSRRASRDAGIVALGVVALSAPWWIPVLSWHGLGPILAAGGTGFHSVAVLFYPLFMMFTEEPAMTLVAALAAIGFFLALARRRYFIPALLILPFAVDPRSAATVATVAAALLGAEALHRIVLPGIAAAVRVNPSDKSEPYFRPAASRAAIIYLEGFLLLMAVYAGTQLAQVRVSTANRTAFDWISQTTPPASRFLVLTGDTELFCDPVQEWFPALTNRISATTLQGHEWIGDGRFAETMAGLQRMQLCMQTADPATCVVREARALRSRVRLCVRGAIGIEHQGLQRTIRSTQRRRPSNADARGRNFRHDLPNRCGGSAGCSTLDHARHAPAAALLSVGYLLASPCGQGSLICWRPTR